MKHFPSTINNQLSTNSGFSIMMVLTTTSIVLTLALLVAAMLINELHSLDRYSRTSDAYALANAGINAGIAYLNAGKTFPAVGLSGETGKGTYTVSFSSDSNVLSSSGIAKTSSGDITKRISTKLIKDPQTYKFEETFSSTKYKELPTTTAIWEEGKGTVTLDTGLVLKPEFNVSNASLAQREPDIAYNSTSDQFMIVWQDWRTTAIEIWAQINRADETVVRDDFLVNPLAPANRHYDPSIAYNSRDNQYMVTWWEWQSGALYVYARRFRADGNPEGDKFRLSSVDTGESKPSIAYNSRDNQYLITWRARITNSDIYARRVNANGTMADSSPIPISTADYVQQDPSVAYNSYSNQFLVAWDHGLSNGYSDIYGQKVNADGNLDGGNFPIFVASSWQKTPAIAYNSTNYQFMVTFDDSRAFDVYGQRLSSNGATIGGAIPIGFDASTTADMPSVAYNSQKNLYMVTWEEYRSSLTQWDILARVVNFDGSLLGSNISVSGLSYDQKNPAIAYDSKNNQFMIAWQDLRSGQNDDIWARRLAYELVPGYVKSKQGRGNLSQALLGTSEKQLSTFRRLRIRQPEKLLI